MICDTERRGSVTVYYEYMATVNVKQSVCGGLGRRWCVARGGSRGQVSVLAREGMCVCGRSCIVSLQVDECDALSILERKVSRKMNK